LSVLVGADDLAARAGAEAARIAVSAPGIGGLLAALTPEAAR